MKEMFKKLSTDLKFILEEIASKKFILQCLPVFNQVMTFIGVWYNIFEKVSQFVDKYWQFRPLCPAGKLGALD